MKFYFFLLFFCCSVFSASAQSSIEDRLVRAIYFNDYPGTMRLLDSSRYDVSQTGRNNLNLFQYSMFHDSLAIFRNLLARIDRVTSLDLATAAAVGQKSVVFKETLQRFYSTDPDDYEEASIALLSPMTDSVRRRLSTILSDFPATEEEVEETEEEIYDLERVAAGMTDTTALKILISRVEGVSSKKQAAIFFLSLALDQEVKEGSVGSFFLINKYIRSHSGPIGPAYIPEHFKLAFQAGRWSLVDLFLQRGIEPDYSDIDIGRIKDPERALGYFTKQQLLVQSPDNKSLLANRAWKIPGVKVVVPAKEFLPGTETIQAPFSKAYTEIFGSVVQVNGTSVNMAINRDPVCGLSLKINYKDFNRYTRGNCTGSIIIKIPASDTANKGEYSNIRIINTGQYAPDGDADYRFPVKVYRGSLLIDSVRVGDEKIITRAFGPLELRTAFRGQGPTFGIEARFLQREHPKISAADLRSRISFYQHLWELKNATADISDLDTRTERLLVSQQLQESGIPQNVMNELRAAMQVLAEESEFTIQFYNLVYKEILGGDVFDALEPFILSNDPVIRQQARILLDVLNRRTQALYMLDQVNIQNYSTKVLRVQNLLYELAQFYDKENYLLRLTQVLSDLSPAAKERFFSNAKQSNNIWTIRDSDLDGKGEVIHQFLKY